MPEETRSAPIGNEKEPDIALQRELRWRAILVLCQNLFKFRLLSYYFWSGILLIVQAIALIAATYSSQMDTCEISVIRSSLSIVFLLFGILSLLLALLESYSSITALDSYTKLTFKTTAVGFIMRLGPLLTRIAIVFCIFPLQTICIYTLFSPSCNEFTPIVCFSICLVFQTISIIYGVTARSNILIPTYIYIPSRNDGNLPQVLIHIANSFGP